MSTHPADNQAFDPTREHRTFYLAHPVADDEDYTREQNLDHVVKLVRLFYEHRVAAVAPYHTMCLGIPETDEGRSFCLEVDCSIVRRFDGIILTGHKLSRGMEHELRSACGFLINFIGHSDEAISHLIQTDANTKWLLGLTPAHT